MSTTETDTATNSTTVLSEEKVTAVVAEFADDTAEEAPTLWESELAYEGLETSDGRYLIPGKITNRDLPLSIMSQTETEPGHMGAEVAGKITKVWRVERNDLGDGVIAIMGSGEFASVAGGPEAEELVDGEYLRGVSVDLAASRVCLIDRETKEEVPESEVDWDKLFAGEYLTGIEGEIMGATICAFPAFAQSTIRVVQPEEAAVTASADEDEKTPTIFSFNTAQPYKIIPMSITASAAGIAPIAPPKDWFFTPEVDGKLPLTVMDDGRVMGHLATWDQCHHGFLNECVLAKQSRTEYKFFHVGAIKTSEGEMVNVGRIVVGETAQSGHASVSLRGEDASKYYDKTAMVGAFVRAVDGKYGIWLSGVVRSDCPAEKVRDMLANPPSGDWRRENGWLELIAALSVPVPGFPVPRYEYSLVASAETTEVQTLIATGYYEVESPSLSRAEQRRKELLLRQAHELTGASAA